jgi:hypothetical protein
MRTCTIRHCFVIALFVIPLMGVFQSPALGIQINAIDDAGQYAGQDAYLKFVYSSGELPITTGMVSDRWTSASQVYTFASNNDVLKDTGWHLESAGNIWSSDKIVGEAFTAPHAGVYRISPVDGAFTYDNFNWSGVAGKWLWQLQIYAVGGDNYTLGSQDLYDSAAVALGANLGKYMDIALAEGGELIFWIADGNLGKTPYDALHRNSIDNSGSLTFDVATAPIPEPSTLILVGTGLFFLVRRLRGSLILLN